MNFIFIFILSCDTNLLRKKSVKKTKKRWPKGIFSKTKTGLSGKTDGTANREVKDKVCDGLEYLYSRADFWRQQKPMYARKRDKERQQRAMRRGDIRQKGSMDKILRNLEEIDEGTI